MTDTAYIRLFMYGGDCKKLGDCRHGLACTLPLGCEAGMLTATPKQAKPCKVPNCDSTNHSYNIEWAIGTACNERPKGCVWFKHSVDAGPFRVEDNGAEGFNKLIVPQSRGAADLWVKLTEPQDTYYHVRHIFIR